MPRNTNLLANPPQISKKDFYIFGQGIAFSMSPLIHTAAFQYHGLPHTYRIYQTTTIDELAPLISSSSFGGSSVTMPHKLQISRFCDETTKDAKLIGAVNTLIVTQDPVSRLRKIVGDNTDWSGLLECLNAKGEGILETAETGLVIGAGGASRAALYALHKSGVKHIYIVNRTQVTAEQIALDYSALFKITVMSKLSQIVDLNLSPDIIIGTIPADVTRIEDFPAAIFANKRGICVDMAYKPRSTPLLGAAQKAGGWKTVTGVEVLLEQAFDQSRLWLGLPAPKELMTEQLEEADRKQALGIKTYGKP